MPWLPSRQSAINCLEKELSADAGDDIANCLVLCTHGIHIYLRVCEFADVVYLYVLILVYFTGSK